MTLLLLSVGGESSKGINYIYHICYSEVLYFYCIVTLVMFSVAYFKVFYSQGHPLSGLSTIATQQTVVADVLVKCWCCML